MTDFIQFTGLMTNYAFAAVILQTQSWDLTPTTVFTVLVSALITAVYTLWRAWRKKDREFQKKIDEKDKEHKSKIDEKDSKIEELNKLLLEEVKELLKNGNSKL